MKNVLLVFVGSGIGGSLRFLLGNALRVNYNYWSTALINIIGSLILGGLMAKISGQNSTASFNIQLFLCIGLCGGFTTFSTFSLEAMQLMQAGNYGQALLYTSVSLVLCIVFCWLGFLIINSI
jgi:fluoride exporter